MAKIFPVQQRAKLDFQPIPGDTVELDGLVEEHVRADRWILGSILRLGERFTTTTVVADWNRFAASMMSNTRSAGYVQVDDDDARGRFHQEEAAVYVGRLPDWCRSISTGAIPIPSERRYAARFVVSRSWQDGYD
ncbi:MAG: hypothetical protein ABSE79_13490 [Terriglobia bacterium]